MAGTVPIGCRGVDRPPHAVANVPSQGTPFGPKEHRVRSIQPIEKELVVMCDKDGDTIDRGSLGIYRRAMNGAHSFCAISWTDMENR